MSLKLALQDERREGKIETWIEAILALLEDLGTIPDELHERITEETDLKVLRQWHKLAAKVDSIEAFIAEM